MGTTVLRGQPIHFSIRKGSEKPYRLNSEGAMFFIEQNKPFVTKIMPPMEMGVEKLKQGLLFKRLPSAIDQIKDCFWAG